MNRGGRTTIARRVMAAVLMLGLGAAVIGGGVAFADSTVGSGAPATPGVTTYQVDTPSAPIVFVDPVISPSDPAAPSGVVTANEWVWG